MKQTKLKEYAWPTVSLVIICTVVSLVLALTNHYTKDIIKQNEIDAANIAKLEVLPGAAQFEEIVLDEQTKAKYDVVDVVRANNGAGTVITIQSNGYHGMVPVMVGFNTDKAITAIKVLENEETVGVGTKVEEPAYCDQYKGITNDLSAVQGITGATYSSKAVQESVRKAIEVLALIEEAA